jgi:hypothetical protein
MDPHINGRGWYPTRKWLVARVTALAGWLIAWIQADTFNDTLAIAGVTLLAEALTSYLTSNVPPPGE